MKNEQSSKNRSIKQLLTVAIIIIIGISVFVIINNAGFTGLAVKGGFAAKAQCADKIDNDLDNQVDFNGYRTFPKDTDCTSITDNTECPVACSGDTNCGANGFGPAYCFNGNVYADYTDYNCVNPSNCNAYCTEAITPSLLQNCQYGCEGGVCKAMPQDSCSDSDGGINLQVKGITSGYLNGYTYSYSDSCLNTTGIIENYCSGASKQSQYSSCGSTTYGVTYCINFDVYRDVTQNICSDGACNSQTNQVYVQTCSNGCTNGACNSPPSNSCSDSDGGYNIQVQGIVSGYSGGFQYSLTDSCTNSTGILTEHYCAGTSKTWATVDCLYAFGNTTGYCYAGTCIRN